MAKAVFAVRRTSSPAAVRATVWTSSSMSSPGRRDTFSGTSALPVRRMSPVLATGTSMMVPFGARIRADSTRTDSISPSKAPSKRMVSPWK